jgi:hypothetical protein
MIGIHLGFTWDPGEISLDLQLFGRKKNKNKTKPIFNMLEENQKILKAIYQIYHGTPLEHAEQREKITLSWYQEINPIYCKKC